MSIKAELNNRTVNLTEMDSSDLFQLTLDGLLGSFNYNKADNLIFDELSKKPSKRNYEIAMNFYDKLLRRNDVELSKFDFSRNEIYESIDDIKKLYYNI